MPSEFSWRHSIKKQRDRYAHPNSLYAKAKNDPELLEKILKGMKEADEDLASMEAWYRQGFR